MRVQRGERSRRRTKRPLRRPSASKLRPPPRRRPRPPPRRPRKRLPIRLPRKPRRRPCRLSDVQVKSCTSETLVGRVNLLETWEPRTVSNKPCKKLPNPVAVDATEATHPNVRGIMQGAWHTARGIPRSTCHTARFRTDRGRLEKEGRKDGRDS